VKKQDPNLFVGVSAVL